MLGYNICMSTKNKKTNNFGKIEFNKVTWYSKLAAIVFFLAVFPMLTFYIGMKYEETRSAINMNSL